MCRLCLALILAVGCSTPFAQTPAAGTATGTLTVKGNAIKLAHADAFVKLDGPPGKTLAGTAKSTEAAAKLSDPVSLNASFNATLQ